VRKIHHTRFFKFSRVLSPSFYSRIHKSSRKEEFYWSYVLYLGESIRSRFSRFNSDST